MLPILHRQRPRSLGWDKAIWDDNHLPHGITMRELKTMRSTESSWMPPESPAVCRRRFMACGPGYVPPVVGAVAGSCPTK